MDQIVALIRQWPAGVAIVLIVNGSIYAHSMNQRLWIIDYIGENVPPVEVTQKLMAHDEALVDLRATYEKTREQLAQHERVRNAHHD